MTNQKDKTIIRKCGCKITMVNGFFPIPEFLCEYHFEKDFQRQIKRRLAELPQPLKWEKVSEKAGEK